MGHIEINYSLDSKLQTFYICSIRILNILEVIAKTSFSILEKCSTLLRGQLPMLKMVTPMTTIAVAIFAGGNVELVESNHTDASDSEYDEIRPDLGTGRYLLLYILVGIMMRWYLDTGVFD